MEISLQLYSIQEETKRDFKEALHTVGEIGYNGVEFAGFGGLSAADMTELLKRNNLYSVGAHYGLDVFENRFEEELAYNKAIGSEYMICPYATFATRSDVDHLVDVLNAAGEKAAKENIKVGYHNHDHELEMMDGASILDLIAEKTNDHVILELDVFWLAYAGIDPVAYIKKWGKKVELIHIKQIDAQKANVDVADGVLDMAVIKDAAVFAKYFILEHEEFDKPVWDSIRNDFDSLKKI